jgi:hypothetical protein
MKVLHISDFHIDPSEFICTLRGWFDFRVIEKGTPPVLKQIARVVPAVEPTLVHKLSWLLLHNLALIAGRHLTFFVQVYQLTFCPVTRHLPSEWLPWSPSLH